MESNQVSLNKPENVKLDFKYGKYATGRRKTSIAKVWLSKGSGKIKVNGKNYAILHKTFENPLNFEKKDLLVFENNLYFEITDFANQKFTKILLIVNKNENRNIQLSENVVKFKAGLIEDQRKRLEDKSIDCKIIDINEIKNLESCYCLYPTVGENLDYINQNSLKNIEFLFRKLD